MENSVVNIRTKLSVKGQIHWRDLPENPYLIFDYNGGNYFHNGKIIFWYEKESQEAIFFLNKNVGFEIIQDNPGLEKEGKREYSAPKVSQVAEGKKSYRLSVYYYNVSIGLAEFSHCEYFDKPSDVLSYMEKHRGRHTHFKLGVN